MAKIQIPLIGDANNFPGIQLDSETCINWYLVHDPTGKYPKALLPDPGLEVWTEISGAKSVRSLFELNKILYSVIDSKFYSFDVNGNEKELGTLKTSVGNVRIIPNDNQLFLTDIVHGYVYQIIKNADHEAGEFFIVDEATSLISQPVFDGAGLDDMKTSGEYTGIENKDYVVEIDGVGTPDTFKWSDSKGTSFNDEKVPITGGSQVLNDDAEVIFGHTEGHTLNDKWNFSATADSSFYVPVIPAYIDGYGVYVKKSSDRWYISALDDFSNVNAQDFAKESAWPDDLVVAFSIREELWLIGRTTSRVWYNTGAAAFPFEPRTNLLIKYGTLAPYSVAVAHNNILLWLANNEEGGRVVIMMDGYNAQIISDEPLNDELRSYDNVDDAIGFVYQWNGHIFYALILPSADKTWVYDLIAHSWHEKRSTRQNEIASSNQLVYGRWLANNFVYFNDLHLVGDYKSGKIYKLSSKIYTEDGNFMLNERTTKVTSVNLHRLSIYSLQVDMQKGVGLTEQPDQGHNPTVMLQISNDDGSTWGNELWQTIGKTGKYRERIFWTRLGQSDSYTFRVRVTDPVYKMLMGAVIEVEDMQT